MKSGSNEFTVLVTGGAGFIGSNFIRHILYNRPTWRVLNLDSLTYAGNLANLSDLPMQDGQVRHKLYRASIGDTGVVEYIFNSRLIDYVVHFAAETHVDNSITVPEAFTRTNVLGTQRLLDIAREQMGVLKRFVHISTDEVYGSLGPNGYFTEESNYAPNSPYSASKAASDHLVRAYHKTYGLPTVITHCSNNYGPNQHLEKMIPKVICNAIANKEIPIYGQGAQRRDWLYVKDCCEGILAVLEKGKPGSTYNLGTGNTCSNLALVNILCELVDKECGKGEQARITLRRFVDDRPGHDFRYAIDPSKALHELGWSPRTPLSVGLKHTIWWYINNPKWVDACK